MLKKRDRLSRRELETLLRKGRRVHGEVLSICTLPSEHGKAAVIVSKKTARKAVQRHTLRRRVYGVLEHHRELFQERSIAVLLRPQASQMTYTALEEALTTLLKQR